MVESAWRRPRRQAPVQSCGPARFGNPVLAEVPSSPPFPLPYHTTWTEATIFCTTHLSFLPPSIAPLLRSIAPPPFGGFPSPTLPPCAALPHDYFFLLPTDSTCRSWRERVGKGKCFYSDGGRREFSLISSYGARHQAAFYPRCSLPLRCFGEERGDARREHCGFQDQRSPQIKTEGKRLFDFPGGTLKGAVDPGKSGEESKNHAVAFGHFS